MIDLVYLSYKKEVPPNDYWDHGMLNALFAGELWNAVGGFEFEEKSLSDVATGAVVVFPARNQLECAEQLNNDLARLQWVVLILTGDEANEFPAEKITHPNMKLWVMSPNPEKYGDDVRKIGSGWPPQARLCLPAFEKQGTEKKQDYYFAGQITHERRQACAAALEVIKEHKVNNKLKGSFLFTEGFTQGEPHTTYYSKLAAAKTAPCPSGPETPETFRLFEALEAGCIPIADAYSPKLQHADYWTYFFGDEPPFPVFTSYDQMTGYMRYAVDESPRLANKVFAWWQGKKREMAYWLQEDINALAKLPLKKYSLRDQITVIIPTSPIPSHPSTAMIEQTISDVRAQLPRCEIIISIDGVREEQKDRTEAYEQYKRNLLWKCNFEWDNVLPVVFDEHMHQASMAREILKMVKTPTILYVEHDAPIIPDRDYPWQRLVGVVVDGTANVIRFNHEASILSEHQHLIIGENTYRDGVWLTKTRQWSQRPHLASTTWYKHMIETYFNPASRTMIEDVIHGIVEMDLADNGEQAWFNWRIFIYTPEGGDIKRSYHLDGRGNDPKFEMDIKPVERV